MKFSGVCLLLVLLAPLARANDSSFEAVGGTPRPMKGENPHVRMESERVVLSVGKDDYGTRAEFVFVNDSNRRVAVMMGFPEENSGDVAAGETPKKTTFKNFSTSVDGTPIVAKRTILSKPDAAGIVTYWIKSVSFAPRQTRRVRVSYRSPFGGTTSPGFNRAISYNFTGGNWKGKVTRSDLEVRFSEAGLWRVFAETQSTPISLSLETRPGAAILRRTWREWEAQTYFLLGLSRTLPFWMEEPNQLMTPTRLQKSLTFRTGGKAGEVAGFSGHPPAAFTQNGVVYVALPHLEQRLNAWKYAIKQDEMNIARAWNPRTRQISLVAGPQTLVFSANSREMELRRGAQITKANLPAPVLSLRNDWESVTYLPLAPVAQALGFSFSAKPETRNLVLSRGQWPSK